MQVMHDRVLIKKIEPKNTTSSGIVLAGTPDKTFEAMVLKVGSGKPVEGGTPIPLTVQVGDKVLYNSSAAISVTVDGESLLVIKEDEIFAIIN
jgi:chaperonin GroES